MIIAGKTAVAEASSRAKKSSALKKKYKKPDPRLVKSNILATTLKKDGNEMKSSFSAKNKHMSYL